MDYLENDGSVMKKSLDLHANVDQNFSNDVWGLNENPIVPQPVPVAQAVQHKAVSHNGITKQTVDADNELQRLVVSNQSIDDRTKDLLFKNQSLIQRLFPTHKDRMVAEMQGKIVQSAFDFRLNLYKISTEFKIEAVREHFNALLLNIRGEYRQRVSDFMLLKLEQLHLSVDARQRSFIELAKAKLLYAQTLPTMLQGRYLAVVEREAEGFLNFTERQISHFESIIDEQIQKLS
jgi:hypothetical protein